MKKLSVWFCISCVCFTWIVVKGVDWCIQKTPQYPFAGQVQYCFSSRDVPPYAKKIVSIKAQLNLSGEPDKTVLNDCWPALKGKVSFELCDAFKVNLIETN